MDDDKESVNMEESAAATTEASVASSSKAASSNSGRKSNGSSRARAKRSSPRRSLRNSSSSGKSSPKASSSRGSVTPPVMAGKRDREVPSDDDGGGHLSPGTASDDSNESSKKIRKQTDEGKSEKDRKTSTKYIVKGKLKNRFRKADPAVDNNSAPGEDMELEEAMSCEMNATSSEKSSNLKDTKNSKRNKKNNGAENAGGNALRNEADNQLNGDGCESMDVGDSKPCCSNASSKSKTSANKNCNKSNTSTHNKKMNGDQDDDGSISTSPKRRSSRSYRSRLDESSDDEDAQGREAGATAAADGRTASTSRSRRRSSTRRTSTGGELRDSSVGVAAAGGSRRDSSVGAEGAGGSRRDSSVGAVGAGGSRRENCVGAEGAGGSRRDSSVGAEGAGGRRRDSSVGAEAASGSSKYDHWENGKKRQAFWEDTSSSDDNDHSPAPPRRAAGPEPPSAASSGEGRGQGTATPPVGSGGEAAPGAEEEEDSVAQRVRRRRVGRGGREKRPSGERASTRAARGEAQDGSAQERIEPSATAPAPAAAGDGEENEGEEREAAAGVRAAAPRRAHRHRMYLLESSSDSSDSSHTDSDSSDSDSTVFRSRNTRRRLMPEQVEAEVKAEIRAIQEKKQPKHDFHFMRELINRQYGGGLLGPRFRGVGSSRSGLSFSQRYYSSLHTVERLELMAKLDHHQGCVNAIGFSNSGSVLVSGSDDLQVALWDWNRERLIMAYETGHRNNVFQCKFLPLPGDRHIVTCARDGQVRLAEVADATVRSTRRLAKHSGPSHKLAVTPARPQIVLSAGEDGEVKESDVRQEQANTIAITNDSSGHRVALYSIHNHPLNENQFCVAGRDEFVCVYDRRITTATAPPVLKYCPDHLRSARPRANVTCAVYSNNGDAILASYNDEDIYLFDTSLSCNDPYTHRYSGHRNNATVKGVNMFGPHSQYVMSGSDCGNVFIWSRETEAIVRCFNGDDNGVVNVLEWHPHLPLLATSGLDSDVKLWMPSGNSTPDNDHVSKIVETNLRERRNSSSEVVDLTDSRMIMMIWDHMRRMQGNRGGGSAGSGAGGRRGSQQPPPAEGSDSDDEDDPYTGAPRHLQCATQ